jgi:hypothetical protein
MLKPQALTRGVLATKRPDHKTPAGRRSPQVAAAN